MFSGKKTRQRIIVTGAVQGVGFRPFVYRIACEQNLAGWVQNTPEGVIIEVEGEEAALTRFDQTLKNDLPPVASIRSLNVEVIPPEQATEFEIIHSDTAQNPSATVLADLALCEDCLREMNDPTDRRYRYPFITCTNCGPRFTIMAGLPYDRPQTSMAAFPLCDKCTEEYENPLDRRFHAQPLACPDCGPQLALRDADGAVVAEKESALQRSAAAIREGKILAMKGLGGFHLVCDARNEDAVRQLRERKYRPAKPFAVMVPSLEAAQAICEVSETEAGLLASAQAPIVLLQRKPSPLRGEGWVRGGRSPKVDIDCPSELSPPSPNPLPAGERALSALADDVAPGNPNLGVMLPYTPLHHLLMQELQCPVVATSGNRASEPICTDENEALERLSGIADLFLIHNRPIVHRADDSIVRVMGGRPVMLRRGRGYAPMPFFIEDSTDKNILAAGGHLKNTVALAVGGQIVASPHIGDLDTPEACRGHEQAIDTLCDLYRTQPDLVVHDLHPDYMSTKMAQERFAQCEPVQHHYAHALACMADNRLEGGALAVVWDGTGYGTDGTIWGGEFLTITEDGFERTAHLLPFPLPGGDAAAKEPQRTALGMLFAMGRSDAWEGENKDLLLQTLNKNINCPLTSSAGRLFDGAAALLGLCQKNTFEGQAAMALEFSATTETEDIYPYEISGNVIDWRPMIAALMEDNKALAPTKFHNTLAAIITDIAKRSGQKKTLLTGGCFQNKTLLEKTITRLYDAGLEPYWHRDIPPNDGGLAVGQIIAATKKRAK